MLSFTQRDVKEFFKKARRVLKHPGLDILQAPRTHETARILVITPRRVGNAVERNKIRRRLKAIFHEEKFFNKEYDSVVIIKSPGITLSFAQLQELLRASFAHSGTVTQ